MGVFLKAAALRGEGGPCGGGGGGGYQKSAKNKNDFGVFLLLLKVTDVFLCYTV